eukprot:SAG11_NODE_1671_length_4486_cov_1.735127_4_plen_185_part_00
MPSTKGLPRTWSGQARKHGFDARAVLSVLSGAQARRSEPHPSLDELHPAEALDALLARADFVLLTIPHTPQTEGLFDASKFAQMQAHAVFVNVGRGATVVLDDLDAALRAGTIGGAALDVFETEPLPSDHPLWQAPNCLLTPHVAIQGDPEKTTQGHIDVVVRNVGLAIRGEELENIVDKHTRF